MYVKALNPPILGKISKDLNIICVHLHPNIYVYEMHKMFNSCLCVLCGVLLLSSVIKTYTRQIWALSVGTKWRADALDGSTWQQQQRFSPGHCVHKLLLYRGQGKIIQIIIFLQTFYWLGEVLSVSKVTINWLFNPI